MKTSNEKKKQVWGKIIRIVNIKLVKLDIPKKINS